MTLQMNREEVGADLCQARLAKNLSQKDLANALRSQGISIQVISRLERGTLIFAANVLPLVRTVANYLDVKLPEEGGGNDKIAAKPANGSATAPASTVFSNHSTEELSALQKQIDAEIAGRRGQEIHDLRIYVVQKLAAIGATLEEVFFPKRVTKHSRGPQAARYRGPAGEEWSGRGPAPRWMKDEMARGGAKEDFLIETSS